MMAMSVSASSPWGRKPGSWALDAEEHEKELQSMQQEQENSLPPENDSAFPSLAVAAATKQPKKNKKMSLAEFTSATTKSNSSALPHDVMLNLPTAPRRRSPEELDRNRLGGGFQSYGRGGDDSLGNRQPRFPNRDGGRDREREREYAPSRADEVDDWSKTKKSPSFNGGYERRERNSGSMFDDSRSISKADESDNWASSKVAMEPRKYDRRGSFDSISRGRDSSYGGGGADSDNWGRKKDDGIAPQGGRPKLVLQPRTIPLNSPNSEGTVTKPRANNPFGEARPREEVLAEKGKDWKEIDEKLDASRVSLIKEPERKEQVGGWRKEIDEKLDASRVSLTKEPERKEQMGGWRKDRGRDDAAPLNPWRKPDSSISDAGLLRASTSQNEHVEGAAEELPN